MCKVFSHGYGSLDKKHGGHQESKTRKLLSNSTMSRINLVCRYVVYVDATDLVFFKYIVIESNLKGKE